MKSKFSKEFHSALEDRISRLEEKTSVEIVPVFEHVFSFYLKYPLTFFWPTSLLPSFFKPRDLETRAHQIFLNQNLHSTKQRNALMIFVSEAAHSVYLLADRGLAEKIDSEIWSNLGRQLAEDFNLENAGDSFFKTLDELEPKLIEAFPADASNINELSNELREIKS